MENNEALEHLWVTHFQQDHDDSEQDSTLSEWWG